MRGVPALTSWDHRQATIALSKPRRELLRAFADSVGPGLSKPEAVYALIDRALPLVVVAVPNPEAEANREVAHRSAEALERVAAALAPLEDLISADREPLTAEVGEAGEPRVLGIGEWVSAALARLNMSPAKLSLTMRCLAIDLAERRALLRFSVSRLELDGDARYAATAALPGLRIAIDLPNRSSDISLAALAAGVSVSCARGARGWNCELLAAGSASREPLHRFQF